jgi:MFS family permease
VLTCAGSKATPLADGKTGLMTKQDRQGRVIASAVFVSLFFIWGSGYETFPIFFPALLKNFGWSKARLGLMSMGFSVGFIPSVLVAGWLLDRIEARWVMGTGAMLVVGGFVLASRSGAFSTLFAANVILGLGLGASTFVPAALVIANWFDERLGLVLGLTMSGMEVGGTGMMILSERIITTYGWRAAYLTLACLILMISLPSVLIFVRTRPKSSAAVQSVAESAQALAGLEVREAFYTRAFWMLIIAGFGYGLGIAGTFVHLAEYLLGVEYSMTVATLVVAVALGMQAVGRPIIGSVGDRVGSRNALVLSFVCLAIATILLLYVRHRAWLLAIYVVTAGLNGAAPATVMPMMQAETLGLKRFGSIGGLLGLAGPAGVAIGPALVGRIADAHSYTGGFELCAMSFVAAGVASFLCVGPPQEQALAIEAARKPATL